MMRPTRRLSRCPAGSSGRRGTKPRGETPPGFAEPPKLLEDPLDRDRDGLSMIFDLPTWRVLMPRMRGRKNVFPFDL